MGKRKLYKSEKSVYCVDATQWGFIQKAGKMYVPDDANTIPDNDKLDLILTKEGVDYLKLNKQCLISVGGYIHYHDADKHRLLVEGGLYTQRALGTNHVGIIGFGELGEDTVVELHRIDPATIVAGWRSDYQPVDLSIGMPGVDFNNKLVGIVLAGELYWLNGHHRGNKIGKITGDSTFRLLLERWHILQKISTLSKFLRFNITEKESYPRFLNGQYDKIEILSMDFIEKLFRLSQTFLVTVKTSKPIRFSEIDVVSHQLSKRYFVPENQFKQVPLRCGDGRYLPYFVQQGGNGLLSIITEDIDYIPYHMDRIPDNHTSLYLDRTISTRSHELKSAKLIVMKVEENS